MASPQMAIVFARLDPILKSLLEGLTSLKSLLPSISLENCEKEFVDHEQSGSTDKIFVTLVQKIAKELESLTRGMRLTSDSSQPENVQPHQRLQHAKALCLLTKYVTLPLTAIFHLPLRDIYTLDTKSRDNQSNNRKGETALTGMQGNPRDQKLQIRRSYVYKLYRLAAVAIRTFVEETTINDTSSMSRNLLQSNTWIEYLVAFVHCMPTYSEISITTSSSSLDDGTDAWVTILQTTKQLLYCFEINGTKNQERSEGDQTVPHLAHHLNHPTTVLLVEAWHGTLSMRLVDCLTAFLASSKKYQSALFSPQVHYAALETLFSLLEVTSPSLDSNGNKESLSASDFWRSVFPGVFTALYQRIVDNSHKVKESSSSITPMRVHIQRLSLESLIVLLRITCVSYLNSSKNERVLHEGCDYPIASTERDSNADLLAKLTSMAVTANGNNERNVANGHGNVDTEFQSPSNHDEDKKESNDKFQQEKKFFDQVCKRTEGPLIFLLRQLSLSSSDAIRRKVLVLCQVILFETRHCWVLDAYDNTAIVSNTSTSKATFSPIENLMEQIPLELCIGFQQDPDTQVRNNSKQIIETYVEHRYSAEQSSPSSPLLLSPSTWMVPRIVELVQKLSALVHRGENRSNIRENEASSSSTATVTELRTELNLLAGYLQCLANSSNNSRHSVNKTDGIDKRARNQSRANDTSMCNSIVSSKEFRRGLIQLFDVDLNYLNGCNLIPLITERRGSSPIKLRYLYHPELKFSRNSILRSLGKLLGPKYGALFVDEIISDFVEATLQMPKKEIDNEKISSDLLEGWLHEWVGSLIVAQEVLLGCFEANTQREQFQQKELLLMEKQEKRKRRILLSLASSILPLLVDCSIWNLPIDSQITSLKNTTINDGNTVLSPQTLRRNKIVVISLMELILVFCQLLEQDIREVMVSIFFPIVEKTARKSPEINSNIVQQTGLSILKMMSSSCGFQSTEDLIYAEQNQLIAVMVGRLRLPGGSRIPKSRDDAEEVLSVAKISIWVLEMVNRRKNIEVNSIQQSSEEETPQSDEQRTKNSAIIDLVALLDYRFDHLFLHKVLADADVGTVCSLYKAFFNYFLLLFKVNKDATYSFQMKNLSPDSNQPWLDLLSQFRKHPRDTQETDDNDSLEENDGRLLDVTKGDISLFAKLISRGCYLLSNIKLDSRISSCDALTLAFKFLAFVGNEHDDPTDDKNIIRNTILRQVSDSWPSIRARLKSLSEIILLESSSKSSSLIVGSNQINTRGNSPPEDIGTQRIFLSKLFDLVATMCECSGDFFADRFRNDVWPVMARHLEYLLEELQRQRSHLGMSLHAAPTGITPKNHLKFLTARNVTSTKDSEASLTISDRVMTSFQMSDTQRQLISSLLACLNRILQEKECGKAIQKLCRSIGSTLLPLLDIEGQTKIQELSMDCVKHITQIDCDVMRRPLMEMSGTKITPYPLKIRKDLQCDDGKTSPPMTDDGLIPNSQENSTLTNRCRHLLKFMDSLPEQAVV